jgi:hypothetical protein
MARTFAPSCITLLASLVNSGNWISHGRQPGEKKATRLRSPRRRSDETGSPASETVLNSGTTAPTGRPVHPGPTGRLASCSLWRVTRRMTASVSSRFSTHSAPMPMTATVR